LASKAAKLSADQIMDTEWRIGIRQT